MRFHVFILGLLPDLVDASPGPEAIESPNSDATLARFGWPSLGLLQMWSCASSVLITTWMRFFVSRLWASAWKGYCKENTRYEVEQLLDLISIELNFLGSDGCLSVDSNANGRYGWTGVADFKKRNFVLSRINFTLGIPYKQSRNDKAYYKSSCWVLISL